MQLCSNLIYFLMLRLVSIASHGSFWILSFHNKMAAFLWNLFQSVHCLLIALKNVNLRPSKVKIQGRAVSKEKVVLSSKLTI